MLPIRTLFVIFFSKILRCILFWRFLSEKTIEKLSFFTFIFFIFNYLPQKWMFIKTNIYIDICKSNQTILKQREQKLNNFLNFSKVHNKFFWKSHNSVLQQDFLKMFIWMDSRHDVNNNVSEYVLRTIDLMYRLLVFLNYFISHVIITSSTFNETFYRGNSSKF